MQANQTHVMAETRSGACCRQRQMVSVFNVRVKVLSSLRGPTVIWQVVRSVVDQLYYLHMLFLCTALAWSAFQQLLSINLCKLGQ